MRLRYLSVFFFIAVYLIAVEVGLEYRAIQHGYYGHIFHLFNALINNAKAKSKDVEHLSFRSNPVDKIKPKNYTRFWMASASYAEDERRKINELFPNIFCKELTSKGLPCQMLNASKAGYAISTNIKQLTSLAVQWKPDYVILYSMNLDVNDLSRKYLSNAKVTANIAEKSGTTKSFSLANVVEKQIEATTIYSHLRRYFGGYILLSSALHDDIGLKAKADFQKTLMQFIETTKKIGAIPILTTFATRYDVSNYKNIPLDDKLWFVRYNEYLSSKGWVETISEFNRITKDVARKNNIMLLDVAPDLSGKVNLFTDFVHFSKRGHEVIANAMASDFMKYKTKNEQ